MIAGFLGCVTLALSISAAGGIWQTGQTSQAQRAIPELPTVDQVLEKYVAALGGKEAIQKIKTLSAKGSISFPAIQREGTIELYRAAPNRYLFSAVITGFGLTEQCYDGKTAWSRNPHTGLRNLFGAELGQAKREADLYAPLHLKTLYLSMAVKGIEKVDDHSTYVIDAATPEGGRERLYFGQTTGLLVKLDQSVVSPLGTEPMQVYYEDFREVSGVKIPFKRRQVTPGITTEVTLREVEANAPVDESRFQKPKDIGVQ